MSKFSRGESGIVDELTSITACVCRRQCYNWRGGRLRRRARGRRSTILLLLGRTAR